MEILIPVLVLGLLGLIFGAGLALASKKLSVGVDPRLEQIHGLLPGSNCGACGGAGCFGFAERLLKGDLDISACRVSQQRVKEQIARLLGKEAKEEIKTTAVLHCYGGLKVKDRFIYDGIRTCVSANLVLGGPKACVFGCLGLGDCVRVCPFGAIRMSGEGLPVIDEKKCVACNKCVLACPKKLFALVPSVNKVYIACHSKDPGKETRAACPVGCIACRKCEQICPEAAIQIIDNCAVIDYNRCTSCEKCVHVCPMKTIRIRS